jgi:hypothetical protein
LLFTNSMVSPLATVILLGCGSNDERRNRGEFFWLRFTEKRTNETETEKTRAETQTRNDSREVTLSPGS